MIPGTVEYCLPKELEGTVLGKIVKDKLHEIVGARQKWPALSNSLPKTR